MFEVKYKVQDRNLGDSMRAVAEYAVGKPEATLIEGGYSAEDKAEARDNSQVERARRILEPRAKPKTRAKGKLKRGGRPKAVGDTLPDKVAQALLDNPPPRITGEVIRSLVIDAGKNPNSYSYTTKTLKIWGVLTGPDDYGQYEMHPEAYQARLESAND